jgi:repressor LexA
MTPRRPFAHLSSAPSHDKPAEGAPPLTARQRQILDWIRTHIDAHGMPPTRAEIAKGLGFSTPSSAEDHLQALARKGALEILPGASRGLKLKDLPGVPLQGTLPLVGRVAAGSPILAAEHIEGRYRVDPGLFSPRADYLLRVRGASMRDAGILEGDLLAVHRTSEARSGQIVVARIAGRGGDEVTVKRLKRRGREILLVAENPAYAPIVVDPDTTPFAIEGVGVGLIRASRSL